MKCPLCGSEDYNQYVFVLNVTKDQVSKENPSDAHWIYTCPNDHVYDEAMCEVYINNNRLG